MLNLCRGYDFINIVKWTDGEPVQQQTMREIEIEVFYSQLPKDTLHTWGGPTGMPRQRAAREGEAGSGRMPLLGFMGRVILGSLLRLDCSIETKRAGFW